MAVLSKIFAGRFHVRFDTVVIRLLQNCKKKSFGYIRWPLAWIHVWVIPVRSNPKHRRILGENVRASRKRAGLSQEKLAEKADLNTTYISDVERGEENISVDALVRIATALKVPLTDLIRGI